MTVKLDDGINGGGNIATMKRRDTDVNWFAIVHTHNKPLMDTREYEVELEDGKTDR